MISTTDTEAQLRSHLAQGNIADFARRDLGPGQRYSRANPMYTVMLLDGSVFDAATSHEIAAFVQGLEAFAVAQNLREEAAAERAATEQAAAAARRQAEKEFDAEVIDHDGCEHCHAAAGERCTVSGPKYASHPHTGRVDVYLADQAHEKELVAA